MKFIFMVQTNNAFGWKLASVPYEDRNNVEKYGYEFVSSTKYMRTYREVVKECNSDVQAQESC